MQPHEFTERLFTLATADEDVAARKHKIHDALLDWDSQQRGLPNILEGFLKTLRVRPGTVVLFQRNDGQELDVSTLMALSKMFPPGVLCLCLQPGMSLETLDVEQMRASGWQRIPSPQVVGGVGGIDARNFK